MNFGEEYYLTFAMDGMAVLILLGMCMIPKREDEKKDPGVRLFVAIGIAILIGVVFELLTWLLPDIEYRWYLHAIVVSGIIVQLDIAVILLLFFIYADYLLYESPDHLRRHLVKYMIPAVIYVAACIFVAIRNQYSPNESYRPLDIYMCILSI